LPNYDPALAGPAQTPQINTSGLGINPAGAGMAPGGAAGMDFGTGAIDQGVGAIGDATMQMALQNAEEDRWRRMMQMQMGGGMGGGSVSGGGFNSLRGDTGPTGMGWVPPTR